MKSMLQRKMTEVINKQKIQEDFVEKCKASRTQSISANEVTLSNKGIDQKTLITTDNFAN